MAERHLPCGSFANASEERALDYLRARLRNAEGTWILLSNLNHAQHPHFRADEIDLVAIGPTGVYVIEIKHWDADRPRKEPDVTEHEADRIDAKAKRIAGKIRQQFDPGFVTSRLLLTRGEIRFDPNKRPEPHGVSVFGLPEWSDLLKIGGSTRLTTAQIESAARMLAPGAKVALSGDLRTFAGLINLERISDKTDAFHRVYRGQHPTRRDRVILHLYDLSASEEKQAKEMARREFDTIQSWQKSPFVPSLLDSFQEAEGYPGELYFYSLVDPATPSLAERGKDPAWDTESRLAFALAAIRALRQFHEPEEAGFRAILHRNITPATLRVRHNDQPLFTDFRFARLQDAQTLGRISLNPGAQTPFVAPEVQSGGLAAADGRSDIYALCASLLTLFDPRVSAAGSIRTYLQLGCADNPEDRPSLAEIGTALSGLRDEKPAAPPDLPAADYWGEDTVVPFQNSRYKIVGRLGQGGIGQTFKVVELDAHSDEKFGTYVAKVVRDPEKGAAAIRAYRKARAYTTHPCLSTIHEIAPEWEADRFHSLMKWVEGMPLQDLLGVLPLYAEELGETSAEVLPRRWMIDLCNALGELHRVGLVHGDVSPRNIIVRGRDLVLTDYDTVTEAGKPAQGSTVYYSSPAVQAGQAITPSDDVYALAASFFHLLFDREPFLHGADRLKGRGLNWEDSETYPILRPFFDRATHPQAEERFPDAFAASACLKDLIGGPDAASETSAQDSPTQILGPRSVPWLKNLLSSYPGSRHGNSETRGLDSDFAAATYVETHLDHALLREIEAGDVSLVILFGNAGDGKTAFLQHLAQRLGVQDIHSSRRVWETTLNNGKRLKVNLDGAAAWEGKNANQLLDEIFRPFHRPDYARERIHIVAVNNGKLLEWVESQPEDTWLTEPLRQVLLGGEVELDPRFRLIDLNYRSLVGGVDQQKGNLTTDFLDALIPRLLGAEDDHWRPCTACAAQSRCTAWHSVRVLREPDRGRLLRERLTVALQACHQRGEIHITARELRAALSYIFFGVHDCAELHDDPDLRPLFYWQHAFNAQSGQRQGELLAELARFDPALEADPVLDRGLLKQCPPGAKPVEYLQEARRRTWFEPSAPSSITLANGRHLDLFRKVPLMNPEDRHRLTRDLCLGIAHLEDLPARAFAPEQRDAGVPLRITPRTPTESAFWVVKSWDRFHLQAPLPCTAEGLEALHTHLRLIYRYANGGEEVLILGLELFHLLLELKDGVQLTGAAHAGVFANLEIFTQRLAREDARELRGWHPAEEDVVFRIRVEASQGRQVLTKGPL